MPYRHGLDNSITNHIERLRYDLIIFVQHEQQR